VRNPLAILPLLTLLSGAPSFATLTLAPSLTATAHAEAPGGFAAAMGLTAADGTVRTSASVRVALAPTSGGADYAARMRNPVQGQMGPIRQCFASAMVRTSGVQGKVLFELEALAKGKAKAATARDETGDAEMVECMRAALEQTALGDVPVGARSLVSLSLTNPAASVRAGMEQRAQSSASAAVHMIDGGRAESTGATQQGEVQFAVRGSAFLSDTLVEVHQDVASRMAGLLDCRRKASHRNRPAEGTISFEVQLRDGKIAKVATANNGVNDRNAPKCVTQWLSRADVQSTVAANFTVDVTFSR
jgi:hypothetical protein